MLIHLLLLLQLCFYRIECDYWTRSNISKRVIGGYTAFKGEFPYQVAVLHVTDGLICGGSIITKKWVLSAAHCFDRCLAVNTFYIYAGSVGMNCGVNYRVSNVIIHPNYQETFLENDVAMVKIEGCFVLGRRMTPIALSTGCVGSNEDCLALGWSTHLIKNLKPFLGIRFVHVRTITNRRCERLYCGSSVMITSTSLCTVNKYREKRLSWMYCGGPLVSENVQIGVLSYPSRDGKPSVFVRISLFIRWIDCDQTEDLYVLAGSTTLATGTPYNVSSVITHEQYNPDTLENDLALVKMKDKFCFGASIFSIPIYSVTIDKIIQCKALGWGRTFYDADHPIPRLHFVDMKTINTDRCADIYMYLIGNVVKNSNICAKPKEKGKGMCYMDGGSTLMYKEKLIGLLSFEYSKYPSVYTRISSFQDWIVNTIRDNNALEVYMQMEECTP